MPHNSDPTVHESSWCAEVLCKGRDLVATHLCILPFHSLFDAFIQYKMNQRLSNRSQSKVSVERAIKSLYNKEFTSIRSAARYFEMPKSFFIIV